MISNKRNLLIFLALIIIISSSTQIPFHRVTGLIPSLIYPLYLNAGDSIVGICSWTVSADIDLYLYPFGTDLLARAGYLRKQYSENLNPQILPYNITQSGFYYLRVELYSKNPTNYKLEIQLNDKIVKTHYDTAIAVDNGITIKQFTTDNICKAKLFYIGPPLNIGIFAPDTNLQQTPLYTMNQNTTQLFFDVTVNGIWNVVLQHGIINTTQILYSFLLNITTISTDECINYCSNKNNSRGLAPGTTNVCMCKKLYLWNATSQTCESLCQLDPFNPDCITIDCQALQYTIGPDPNIPNGCLCVQTFHFDMQLGLCVINCSEVAFSNGSILDTTDQCECDLHFYFDFQSRCSINCSDIPNGLDPVNNTLDQCTCTQNFYFNVSTLTCIVNCSQIAYSTGPVQDTIDSCYCLPRFYYSYSTFRCQANCTNINYTTGSIVPDKVDQCLCFPYYYWSPQSFSCQSNCILMPYSTGFKPDNNPYACVCRASYFFNSTLGSCQVNCSQIDKATGFVQNVYNKCKCIPHYYFQQSKGLCLIDCSSIQNSLRINPVNDLYACVCRASFYFNITLAICQVNCSSIINAINRLNDQTCSCTNGFRWNLTTAKCDTACGDGYKTDVQECDDGNTQSSDGCSQNCTLQPNNEVSRGLVVGGSIAGGLAVVVAAAVAKISYNATAVASVSAALGQAVGSGAGHVAAHVAGQSAQNIVNMVDPPFQVL